MNPKRLEKDELARLVEAMRSEGYGVLSPKDAAGAWEYRLLTDGDLPALDHPNTRMPPKSLPFPQSEPMFAYSTDTGREDANMLEEVPETAGKRALLGMRPCDARGVAWTDRIFLAGIAPDNYYLRKREQMLLIGLGCNHPSPTCFCHWTGGGPFSTDGLDLLMTDIGDAYLVRSVTKRGGEILEGAGLADATPEGNEESERIASRALAEMGEALVPGRIRERSLMEVYEDPHWEKGHETCINCGVCAYICPTCTCFDIQDETTGCSGKRVRNWDTCMLSLTSRHASGHNPRPSSLHRYRNRFLDKLKYSWDKGGSLGCVGCGRCIEYCPVNIDIREIIRALNT